MNHVFSAVAFVFVCAGWQETKEAKPAPKFEYDYFKSWDAFAIGSSATFEMETSGTKMTITKTIDVKEAEVIRLKTKTVMAVLPDAIDSTEEVRKQDAPKQPEDCTLCKQPVKGHKDESTWAEKKMKVGDVELTCQVMTAAAKLCDGKDNETELEIWFSKKVPGHMVLMKTTGMTMTVTKFEDKTERREGMKK